MLTRRQVVGWSAGTFALLVLVGWFGYLAYAKVYVRAYNGEAAYEELIRLEQRLTQQGVLKP